jgi:NTE family protein
VVADRRACRSGWVGSKIDMMSSNKPRVAVVLSGGGSRGAYEAGVLLFVRERLPKLVGDHVPIHIVTGTSVGAINGSFLAATIDDPASQATRLCEAWRSLHVEELLSLRMPDLLRAARLFLGGEPPPPAPGSHRYGGLLETGGLERFVVRSIPWRQIRRNLLAGHLDALALSATHVGTGHTHVFIDSREPVPAGWSQDPFVNHFAARITPLHALASAAIPMLFPAVKIGGSFYVDGGLRQNTPMSPAIRLGADRILVISLRHLDEVTAPEQAAQREISYPKPLFLFGKALNALLLDHTEYDLDRMRRLNAILEAGSQAFGPQFRDVINRELIRLRGAPIRPVHAVHIRPSMDIGRMASDFVATGEARLKSRVARRFIERLAQGEAKHESDLLSYLLFDGAFADHLIELGYKDAAGHEEELVRLFAPHAAQRSTEPAPV